MYLVHPLTIVDISLSLYAVKGIDISICFRTQFLTLDLRNIFLDLSVYLTPINSASCSRVGVEPAALWSRFSRGPSLVASGGGLDNTTEDPCCVSRSGLLVNACINCLFRESRAGVSGRAG